MKRGFLRGERVVDPRCVCWWLQTCRPLSSPCGRFPPEALSPGCSYCGMETHAFWLVQLFLFALWVNGLMTLGFTGAHQQVIVCNESLMLEKLPRCGKSFEEMMKKVDSKKWCNLTEFIPYYDNFSLCTEREAIAARCFWPNRLAQGFIIGIHKQFFSNCTSEKVHWEDPPDEILITLILIPVFLMVTMISLVVWCSKRSDILV
ncbi:receptor activity-modifying protein 3 isoform X1 [Malaclemys terrapin pileata]|nr:receptor activity-modifying protein 3 isoform X2 [Chrysemys picta bellii]XP_053875084.1 receptor activity-modifying protein 3 isoform X1 [Malaclemys terrapin pileata]